MPELISIQDLTSFIRSELNTDEATAHAMALHWDTLSRRMICDTDDKELVRDIGRFLGSLNADAAKAEQIMIRKKISRDRTGARKKQLTMFPSDPDDPEQAG